MKQVRNRTARPLRVPLEGGHFLHLGPQRTGQVSDRAIEGQAFRALVERGEIEVVGHAESGPGGRGPQVVGESTHGHQPARVVLPSGNRSGGDGGRGR